MAPFLRVTPISRTIHSLDFLRVIDTPLFLRGVNLLAMSMLEAAPLGEKSLMYFLVSLFPLSFSKHFAAYLAAMDARPFLLIDTHLLEVLSAIFPLVFPVVRANGVTILGAFLALMRISDCLIFVGHCL